MATTVATRDVESGNVVHHMSASGSSNYGTLCSVSTDDDMFEWLDSVPGQRVTCKHCAAIWTMARQYRASDISKALV